MSRKIFIISLCAMFFLLCRNAAGIMVNISEQAIADAIKEGKKKGSQAAKYLKKNYSFGEENMFGESGIIRTKWSKLLMFSSLLADKDRKLSEQEKKRILEIDDLQIDIHTFGNRIDFAKEYKVHLIQKGKIIEPEKVSANHAAYRPQKRLVASGFPKYRATVRSFFPYDKINSNEKTEIVLVKNKKKVVFEVNFADYK